MTSRREQKAIRDEIKKQFDLGPQGVRAGERDLFYRHRVYYYKQVSVNKSIGPTQLKLAEHTLPVREKICLLE